MERMKSHGVAGKKRAKVEKKRQPKPALLGYKRVHLVQQKGKVFRDRESQKKQTIKKGKKKKKLQ